MATLRTNHYGVSIEVSFKGVEGCCGAHMLHNFSAEGRVDKLTMRQKHEMYKDLMRKIIEQGVSGVLNATDCVLNFGEWADLGRGSSQWKKSDSAGDISMEDFCDFFKFQRGPVAKNRNSGNLVATWSIAMFAADPDNDENVTPLKVDKPDFSDEPGPKPDADIDDIIKALQEVL